MFDEEKFIIQSFDDNFSKYKAVPMAIYGLGKNTKVILDNFSDFNICGLMDGVRTGESVWSYRVLSIEEAVQAGVQVIVIVATAANIPIIYRRIALLCEQSGINVFDINGKLLERKTKTYRLPKGYSYVTADSLKAAIDAADVVSFDIFDTLIKRDTLVPTDIFENVCEKYKEHIPENLNYVKERMAAEHELYRTTNPTIDEIYERLQAAVENKKSEALMKLEDVKLLMKLKKAEIEEEFQSLSARDGMIEIVNYAINKNKIICCTSDMYLPADILRAILEKSGYPAIENILVSCEWRVSKANGLFRALREKYPKKRILHIGDNQTSDIKLPLKYGIDNIFWLPSVYQMINDSRMSDCLDYSDKLTDRKIIGGLCAKAFSNPFIFLNTDGRCEIQTEYDLGFYFIYPMIYSFMDWLINCCKENKIDHLLLASRDGWLIKQLLDIRSENEEITFTYDYFYVSRFACTLAGMKDIEDVMYVADMAFDGSMEEMLQKRFLLDKEDVIKRNSGEIYDESDKEYLKRHTEIILKNAEKYRKAYRSYAAEYVEGGKNIGFFDFVSSGTCQLWLENILDVSLTGLYFIQNLDSYKAHLTIHSMYEPKCVYEKQSKMFDNYIYMENILTSFEPSLKYISWENELVFESENRKAEELEALKNIHRGITDAYRRSLRQKESAPSLGLAEDILDLVRSENSVIDFTFFKDGVLRDEFCNRTFVLEDVIGGSG